MIGLSKLKNLMALTIAAMAVGCSSAPKNSQTPAKNKDANLTMTEALDRSANISAVRYDLTFDLTGNQDFYTGQSTVQFEMKNPQSTWLDFSSGNVLSVVVNDKPVAINYDGLRLRIEKGSFKKGPNKIVVAFNHPYSRKGQGLHRFIDEDKRVYLYTDLEPYDANAVFPCFDQPDLKATYTMQVMAPPSWTVITSVRESSVSSVGDAKIWDFPQSQKFSTYIWSLHAGPYHIFTDKAGEIPLRLMVRQSLAKYIQPAEWFAPTKAGFKYFGDFFAYKYPYKKYDQVIVPEFNAGAMENVAAVTFGERFVNRGEKSREQKRDLANVILHEMAHMWFGNLVTMKWWNDLWLNESFATYMASLALDQATQYKEEWQDFSGSTKGWAYWEDQLVTTHPIVGDVPDTLTTTSIFDGITYGKGASVLKQIGYFLGEDKFKKGLQIYFKRHAEKNTELKDFMQALSEGSQKDLSAWQKLWLQTSGVNTLEAKFECTDKKITSFQLVQGVQNGTPVLRPHRLELLALVKKGNNYVTSQKMPVEIHEQITSVDAMLGKACPDLVYPNGQDHAYIKVLLDNKTKENLLSQRTKVQDPFTRLLLWTTLWDEVRDAKLSYKQYGKLGVDALNLEQDDLVAAYISKTLVGGVRRQVGNVIEYLYMQESLDTQSQQLANDIETIMWKRLAQAADNSELQKIFLKATIYASTSLEAQSRLENWLKNGKTEQGLKLDQDQRWSVVQHLAKVGNPKSTQWIAQEKKRDPSSTGKTAAIEAEAAVASMEAKTPWIAEFKNRSSSRSLDQLRAAARGLFPAFQRPLHAKYENQFFTDLKEVYDNRPFYYTEVFTDLVYNECDDRSKSNDRSLERYLNSRPRLQAPVLKELKMRNQESERCAKIQMAAL